MPHGGLGVEAVDRRESDVHSQPVGEFAGEIAPLAALAPVHVHLLEADDVGVERAQRAYLPVQVEDLVLARPRVDVVGGDAEWDGARGGRMGGGRGGQDEPDGQKERYDMASQSQVDTHDCLFSG